MAGERLDYASERQRHDRFVGRAALLDRLDRLLGGDGEPSVVVTGGPGMGKSALLAAWLARREAAGEGVPHHFIRRGLHGWDDPEKIAGSLVAQIEVRCPEAGEAGAGAGMHPAARLGMALRCAARVLRPRSQRLVVVIDGLDEYDPSGDAGDDPFADFVPHPLPPGVRLLCARRAARRPLASLEARCGELAVIDLDDAASAADNEATVRLAWRAANRLELDAQAVDDAVARAGGNLLHAVMAQRYLETVPPDRRRLDDIPHGLAALLDASWQRAARDARLAGALGLLCAAREALTLDEIAAVAGWSEAPRMEASGGHELVDETRRADGQLAYRLAHDAIRAHIAQAIGEDALRRHHGALARRLATWPAAAPAQPYALRHALVHHALAGAWSEAWRIAADASFLEARCRALGVHELEADLARVERSCDDAAERPRLHALAGALAREAHWLAAAPDAAGPVVWNRLRRSGWRAHNLDAQLRVSDARFLRVRQCVAGDNPARVRELAGHTGSVQACAVTGDGRQVVSASSDGTLKLWDLERGRLLRTLAGHGGPVWTCAVTPDGRVVSGAADGTLKLWDLGGRALLTIAGHRADVLACAVTPDARAISASADGTLKVWELASGRWLRTLEGHTDKVTACAMDPDGRSVVSASADGTVRRWALDSEDADILHDERGRPVTACTATARDVILASADATLKVLARRKRPSRTLQGHTAAINACTAVKNYLITASDDRTVKIWLPEGLPIPFATLVGHGDAVTACAASPDGDYVVSASRDRTLRVWEVAWRDALSGLGSHAATVQTCALTSDGRRMAAASDDMLQIRDVETGRAIATRRLDPWCGHAFAVAADTWSMISASSDGACSALDLDSGDTCVLATAGAADSARSSAVTRSSPADPDDETWDPDDEVHGPIDPDDVRAACAATATGARAVTRSDGGILRVWDLAGGHLLARRETEPGKLLACAVTEAGQHVVTVSSEGIAKIWDVPGARVTSLAGHAGPVTACALARWDRCVVSASADGTLRIWDIDGGRELAALQGHDGPVTACACVVTPDGRRVISASADRTLRIWDFDTSACLFVHRGDAPYAVLAANPAVIVAHDAAGAIWILDWPRAPSGMVGADRG